MAMKIEDILKQMDQLLDEASSFPFTNKKQIDAEQMREYIDTLRYNMPAELQKAKDTEENKKKIIADANAQAEDLVNRAKEKAKQITSESELVKMAQAQADEIMANANSEAEETIKAANIKAEQIVMDAIDKDTQIRKMLADDLDKTLTNAENVLTQNLEDVQRTKAAVLSIASPKNN
ncbi:MAG: hypothetical protein K6F91_02225 [Ruminococcus sp.]|nr:hypothetical protein [Ruminococcus sp.]